MKLVIEIDLGNDAMKTGQDVIEALADTSIVAIGELGDGDSGRIRDANGNSVGIWKVEEE
jgi:hypothetical protein